jgi:hypothetical protein
MVEVLAVVIGSLAQNLIPTKVALHNEGVAKLRRAVLYRVEAPRRRTALLKCGVIKVLYHGLVLDRLEMVQHGLRTLLANVVAEHTI